MSNEIRFERINDRTNILRTRARVAKLPGASQEVLKGIKGGDRNAEFYYGTNCDCCITLKFTKHILFFEREDCWEEEMLGRYTNIKFLYFSTLHNNDVKLLSK